jgi:hypothetical protein
MQQNGRRVSAIMFFIDLARNCLLINNSFKGFFIAASITNFVPQYRDRHVLHLMVARQQLEVDEDDPVEPECVFKEQVNIVRDDKNNIIWYD